MAVDGAAVADYYATVFADDWSEADRPPLPAGVLAGVAVAVAGALLVARGIELRGRGGVVDDWQW